MNGSPADDDVDLRFSGPTHLVSALLAASHREDLKTGLDYPGSHDAVAKWALAIALEMNDLVEVDGGETSSQQLTSAGYLVPGTRIHVRLRSLTWKTMIALVPVISGIVITGGVLLPLIGVSGLLLPLKDSVTVLSDEDKRVVLAVALLERSLEHPVSAKDIRKQVGLGVRRTTAQIEETLERLSTAGVLSWTEAGFKTRL